MKERKSKTGKICIAVLLIAIFFLCADTAASQYIEILGVDTYSKNVSTGGTATYNWTVRNIDLALNLTYSVDIGASTPDPAWKVSVSPAALGELKPKNARQVTAAVTAPQNLEEGSANATVVFTVKQNGVPIMFETEYAATSIVIPAVSAEKKLLGYFENPLPAPLDNEFGAFILNVLIWFGIAFVVVMSMDPVVKQFTLKTKTKIDDIVIEIIRTPMLILIILYGITTSLSFLDKYIPPIVLDTVWEIYNVVLILSLFYVGYRLFKDILIYYGKIIASKTASKIDDILIPVIEKVGVVVIGLAALGYVLGYMKIDLTMFVAGGVVVSMVLAFAAQETLSNFFSGIFLLLDRPFKEGDIVILSDGDWCEARKIGMRTTRLFRFSDASMVSIPNNKLVNEKIANFSGPEDKGRVMKTFGVAYGSDPEKVKKIIREVLDTCPYIIKDAPLKPIVRFEEMGESSINFFVLAWLTDRQYRFDTGDYLNTNIYRRFNEEGIEIPFPQRVVHLREEKKE